MQDRVTSSDIVASMLVDTPPVALLRESTASSELTSWCRARARHGAWLPGDQPPAWKRALLHVVAAQDLLRALTGWKAPARERVVPTGESHVPDVLTYEQIAASVRVGGLGALAALAADTDQHEAYVRRNVVRSDYAAAVRAREIPAWERASAMVVFSQDALRWLCGRTRGGLAVRSTLDDPPARLPFDPTRKPERRKPREGAAEPPPEREPRPVKRVERHADIAGYEYDPSWVNGGIGGFRVEHRKAADDRDLNGVGKFQTHETPLAVREVSVQGIAAFAAVADAPCQGIPELAWFHGGADFELGLFSSLEGFIATCLYGGPSEGSNGMSPTGPGDLARLAAHQHRRILGNLGSIPHRHQLHLRRAYTDRRYPRSWVLDADAYGFGVAALVWAAAEAAGDARHKSGEFIVTSATLQVLVSWVRADWPTYESEQEGEAVALQVRLKRAAELVLWTAHFRYRIAAVLPEPKPKKRRKAQRKPDLVPAGTKGRKRRVLIEVPRDTGNEPRAA